MAGDWIKFESATPDKSEVWQIAEELDLDPDAVIGKLLRVWIWFDQHTEKGNAPTVTKKLLDRLVGVSGFCDSMISCEWMFEEDTQIILPNFDHHNGRTAKNRAVTAKRVARHKKSNAEGNDKANDKVTLAPLPNALPKEEKRREDIKEKNKKEKPTRFVKPTPEEIQAYCDERNNGLNGQQIFDHYEANGWMRGKNKIKDWRACVRTWEQSRKAQNQTQDLKSMSDGELLNLAHELNLHTKAKTRLQLIDSIRAARQ